MLALSDWVWVLCVQVVQCFFGCCFVVCWCLFFEIPLIPLIPILFVFFGMCFFICCFGCLIIFFFFFLSFFFSFKVVIPLIPMLRA